MTMLTKHLMEDPVPPSVRRPDRAITVEMDGLVLKALEKDREKRWQSMAELIEAVGVCPGPESTNAIPPGGQTVEMGGAHAAAALRILREKGSAPETGRVSRKAIESALSDAELDAPPRPRRSSPNKTIALVVAGIVLGGVIAAWFALSRGKSQTTAVTIPTAPPPAVVAPTPPSAAALPPAPPSAPAVAVPEPTAVAPVKAEESPEPAAKHDARGHKGRTSSAKPAASAVKPTGAAPAIIVPTPPPPSTPGELKPFPKL
jgi:serine/threonine-protein kinase